MSYGIHRTVVAVMAVAAALAAAEGSVNAAPLKEGEAFPSMKDAEVTGAIPAMPGNLVLVDFWASWCGPCKQSFPVLDALYQEFKDQGFVIVGVSVDDNAGKMEAFLKAHPVTFPIVHDAKKKLVAKTGIEAMPTSFLLDGKGRILSVHKGFKGKETEDALRKEIRDHVGMAGKGGAK